MANVPRFLYFLAWCGAVWGDRFIITPSEFFKEKGTFYSALVIYVHIVMYAIYLKVNLSLQRNNAASFITAAPSL